jgi:hypothetical protein
MDSSESGFTNITGDSDVVEFDPPGLPVVPSGSVAREFPAVVKAYETLLKEHQKAADEFTRARKDYKARPHEDKRFALLKGSLANLGKTFELARRAFLGIPKGLSEASSEYDHHHWTLRNATRRNEKLLSGVFGNQLETLGESRRNPSPEDRNVWIAKWARTISNDGVNEPPSPGPTRIDGARSSSAASHTSSYPDDRSAQSPPAPSEGYLHPGPLGGSAAPAAQPPPPKRRLSSSQGENSQHSRAMLPTSTTQQHPRASHREPLQGGAGDPGPADPGRQQHGRKRRRI